MNIDFIKMHVCGNDFIVFNDTAKTLHDAELLCDISRRLTHRRFGVGGDGFIVIQRVNSERIEMTAINAKGIEMQYCSNAARCAGKLAFDSGMVHERNFLIVMHEETIRTTVLDSTNIKIDMGTPKMNDQVTEVKEDFHKDFTKLLKMNNKEYTYTPILIHGRHIVLLSPEYAYEWPKFAEQIMKKKEFSEIRYVDFVVPYSREELKVRVWNRDTGEVVASGSGATAAVVSSVINGFTDREVFVHFSKGDYWVEWSESNNHVFTTAPVDYVYSGDFFYDEGN